MSIERNKENEKTSELALQDLKRLVRLLARQAAHEHYNNMHVDSASVLDSTSSIPHKIE